MTVILLANVGNHDVELTDPDLLPAELQGRRVPARPLGEELLADHPHYAPSITLPILGPTLQWLIEREGIAPQDLQVYLFASDQNPNFTQEGEWLKDTFPFARIIERYLKDGGLAWRREGKGEPKPLRLTKKQIRLRRLEGSPADYRNALTFFDQELPRVAAWAGEVEAAFLEVSGGTPAMTAMLILAGVETFGQKAHTLYVARDADQPERVGVGRQLFARHTCSIIRTQIGLHAYAIAQQTLDDHASLIMPDAEQRALLRALLDYADRRLAFDFARAREALSEARRYATGDLQAQVTHWNRQLSSTNARDLLAELVHSARIKYQLGDYADFVNRLFRFQEAAFRHLAEETGMQYADAKSDEYIDRDWVQDVAGLDEFLSSYQTPQGKTFAVNLSYSLNRISLGAIVDFFVQRDAAWAHRQDAVNNIHRLSNLARLRNKGISGHGFEGVSKIDLDEAFGDDAGRIVPCLEEICRLIFGQPIGPSPYVAINELCLNLLAG